MDCKQNRWRGARLCSWAAGVLIASAGFSAVETSAVLLGTSLLSATAAPHVKEYVENARATKALGDVKVIAITIFRLASNVGRIGGHQRIAPVLVVSEGTIPEAMTPEARRWAAPLDDGAVQALSAHLVDNAAGYNVDSALGRAWKGPYMDGLSPDPWGARYAANVGLLARPTGQAVIVLSAGPNGLIETPFAQVGLRRGGDDVIGLIGAGR